MTHEPTSGVTAVQVACVAFGGALGAVLRFGVYQLVGPAASFPFATLLVNVVGALLFGLLIGLITSWASHGDTVRLALIVGLLGSFTTFSTFAADTVALAQRGQWLLALGNIAANNLLAIGAVLLGIGVSRWLLQLR